MSRLVLLLVHRREVLLSTILIKIFEGVYYIGHHELDLATPRGGLSSCVLGLAILYLCMLEDADGLRRLQD